MSEAGVDSVGKVLSMFVKPHTPIAARLARGWLIERARTKRLRAELEVLKKAVDHIHNTVGACVFRPGDCCEGTCLAQVVVTEVHCTTMLAGWPE